MNWPGVLVLRDDDEARLAWLRSTFETGATMPVVDAPHDSSSGSARMTVHA